MNNIREASRVMVVVVVAVAMMIASSSVGTLQAQSQGHGLTGTWFWRAVGAVGFYSYNQDGTLTGVSSLIFGTGFSPSPGTLNSSDHGIWRQVGGGFETLVFRMGFDPTTGDVQGITRIRTLITLDPGRESTSGTFFVAQWVCPTPTTCPDPNVDPPNVPEFAPPGNTWTQTRVRLQ